MHHVKRQPDFLGKMLIDTNGKNHAQKILTIRQILASPLQGSPFLHNLFRTHKHLPHAIYRANLNYLAAWVKRSTLGVGEQGAVPEFQDGCKGISLSLMFLVNFH